MEVKSGFTRSSFFCGNYYYTIGRLGTINGCRGCINFDILERKEYKLCLCTGMLYDPTIDKAEQKYTFNQKVLARLKSIKQALFLPTEKDEKSSLSI